MKYRILLLLSLSSVVPVGALAHSYVCQGQIGVGYVKQAQGWNIARYADAQNIAFRILPTTLQEVGHSAALMRKYPYVVKASSFGNGLFQCDRPGVLGDMRCEDALDAAANVFEFSFKTLRFEVVYHADTLVDAKLSDSPAWYYGTCVEQ